MKYKGSLARMEEKILFLFIVRLSPFFDGLRWLRDKLLSDSSLNDCPGKQVGVGGVLWLLWHDSIIPKPLSLVTPELFQIIPVPPVGIWGRLR